MIHSLTHLLTEYRYSKYLIESQDVDEDDINKDEMPYFTVSPPQKL